MILYRKSNTKILTQTHVFLNLGPPKCSPQGGKRQKQQFSKNAHSRAENLSNSFFTKKSKFKKLTLKFSFQGIKCKKGFIFELIFSKRALQIVYIGKPMQISLTKLIFYWKTNANRTHYAHFILENQCKFHQLSSFYIGKPMQISLIRFILYQKTNGNFINKAHCILENECKSH